MKTIKVAQLGQEVREFAVEDSADVGSILATAGISPSGDIKVNGVSVDITSAVENNAVISLIPKVEGGSE